MRPGTVWPRKYPAANDQGQSQARQEATPGQPADQVIEIDPGELSNVFAVPTWLRNAGLGAWFLVGIAILVGALVWLASLTV